MRRYSITVVGRIPDIDHGYVRVPAQPVAPPESMLCLLGRSQNRDGWRAAWSRPACVRGTAAAICRQGSTEQARFVSANLLWRIRLYPLQTRQCRCAERKYLGLQLPQHHHPLP
jgi:hypothetical protein